MSWFENAIVSKSIPNQNGIPIFIEERILTTWDASLYREQFLTCTFVLSISL